VVIAAVAAFASTGNAGIMSASRYPFAMARDHLVSPRFGKIGKTGTPVFSVSVTVGCMIVILLIFDVEAVAKLASAFQLLLFAILCLSVIVMRESKIAGYAPGFRSPLYPWTQIVGMLISVWLIAEMGLLAVSLTGVLIVFCIAWYYYYTNGNLRRQGAIYHVHERLGRKRYERLEHELLAILNEKNEMKSLAYEEVVARSVIVDLSAENLPISTFIERAGDILAGRMAHEKNKLVADLTERYQNRFTNLGNGVFVCYLHYEDVQTPEMVVFRTRPTNLYPADTNGTAIAVLFLVIPKDTLGLDMRLVGHLAEIVQPVNFRSRWMDAESERELRKILISDEHFLHLTLDEYGTFDGFVGRMVSELHLPGECLVAIIHRAGEIIIPHGQTLIEAGDELAIIGNPEDIQALASMERETLMER
ncbi:MAG: TrkA C-terminal domain-containing protein, partial [Balneolaceae bacterium]|nr:TrkA C-terminal domain-containing protein [Balneolaceae bacterium]